MTARRVRILLAFLAWPAAAQPADTVLIELEHIAHIPNAQRLASDPQGMIYIAAGREVIQFDLDGQVQAILGGSDTGHAAFDDVVDIDPGEGLIWVVADLGLSRLMRFSRSLMHLESLPVPRAEDIGFGMPSREEPRDQTPEAAGRPIAVTVTPSGELFTIEEDAQVVIKWDASRRLERLIGHFGDAAVRLVEPVSLASDESNLYVADRGLEQVLAYDLFGGYLRAYPADANLVTVTISGHQLWIVHADRIRVYSTGGEFQRLLRLSLDIHIEGAVPVGEYIVLLSGNDLWRTRQSIPQ